MLVNIANLIIQIAHDVLLLEVIICKAEYMDNHAESV